MCWKEGLFLRARFGHSPTPTALDTSLLLFCPGGMRERTWVLDTFFSFLPSCLWQQQTIRPLLASVALSSLPRTKRTQAKIASSEHCNTDRFCLAVETQKKDTRFKRSVLILHLCPLIGCIQDHLFLLLATKLLHGAASGLSFDFF